MLGSPVAQTVGSRRAEPDVLDAVTGLANARICRWLDAVDTRRGLLVRLPAAPDLGLLLVRMGALLRPVESPALSNLTPRELAALAREDYLSQIAVADAQDDAGSDGVVRGLERTAWAGRSHVPVDPLGS